MKRILIIVILVGAGAAIWWFGRPAYRRSQEHKFAAASMASLREGKQREALLGARQVLAINASNVIACTVMAELAEMGNSPQAVEWRQRIAAVAPTLSNEVALAATALRFEQPPCPIASRALDRAAEQGRNFAPYHIVAAQLALRKQRFGEAEKALSEAIRLDPTNQMNRVSLATLQLEFRDPIVSARAEQDMVKLAADPDVGVMALRALTQHFIAHSNDTEALRFSSQALENKRSTFDDKLRHLAILLRGKRPEASAFEGELQARAATNALETFAVVNQMMAYGEARKALAWMNSLPQAAREQQPVPMGMANAYVALKEWKPLEEYLGAQSWKEKECVRLALLAYAVRNQKDDAVSQVHWKNALREAGDRTEQLRMLDQLAAGWQWRTEREALLWRVVKELPQERWAAEELEGLFGRERNTRELVDLYTVLLERNPTNVVAQNNFASLSFLLNTNLPRAHELAAQVYSTNPNSVVCASTYAWSLYLKGQAAEALKIMEKIDSAYLANPSVAAYYGTVLAANGQSAKAKEYLAKAETGQLLPEEEALVKQSLTKLR